MILVLTSCRTISIIIACLNLREETPKGTRIGCVSYTYLTARCSLKCRSQGVVTIVGQGVRRHDPAAVHDILNRVREYGTSFSERVQSIVQGLQIHPDLDCRFLGIRLSFSDFYKTKKEQQQKS